MIKSLLSWSSGEIDPILHDRVTLEKFNKGLGTGRNIFISKTGSIYGRFARKFLVAAKNTGEAIRIYSPPGSLYFTEWGHQYVRVYTYDPDTLEATLIDTDVTTITEANLPNLHFTDSGDYIYVFLDGSNIQKYLYKSATPAFQSILTMFDAPSPPSFNSVTPVGPPTGYRVDYAVTAVKNGEESSAVGASNASYLKPINAGESIQLDIVVDADYGNLTSYERINIYRRPYIGSAYGYIGSSNYFYQSGAALHAKFEDFGVDADFTKGIPFSISYDGFSGEAISLLVPKTGVIYQQRLLQGNLSGDKEAIIASRPGYQNNFFRDFPYRDDSALKFKAGTSGNAEVLRMLDHEGLIVFTTAGVYANIGPLTVDNAYLDKKGKWVINDSIPPLSTPGGVFFVDDQNTIRWLVYNGDSQTYEAREVSIFSDHLFREKTINSWCFQDGVAPLIIVTFTDGTFATYTHHTEHKMQAWTRHDSYYDVDQVEGTGVNNLSFFVTNKSGNRQIEISAPRVITAAVLEANPEADKDISSTLMDACYVKKNLLNDSLGGTDVFALTPVVAGDWDGDLTLTCGTSAVFTDPGVGAVGEVMRHFNTSDRTVTDLTVKSRVSDDEIVVTPSNTFPSTQASGFRLYETFTEITSGIDHLEGENVSILADGYVQNSPYNDADPYDAVTVSSGEITLSSRAAIIIVGRPIAADIQTLNVNTVAQRNVTIESLTTNKIYMKVKDTRGLFVSNRFPEEDSDTVDGTSVDGMEDLTKYYLPRSYDIIANRYLQPVTKRLEITTPGSWDSQGKISIRQVDPLQFEIQSIVLDTELLERSGN